MSQRAAKLTEQKYWDSVHTAAKTDQIAAESRLDRLLGSRFATYLRTKPSEAQFRAIIAKHAAPTAGSRLLEIGSAPGLKLVEMHRAFGVEPYGIEYSGTGVEQNRETFIRNGLNPENVIHADFFDDTFRMRHAGSFDIVMSRGFIEHFDDPRPVIDGHSELLRSGGTLIVTVPRLRALNFGIAKLVAPAVLPVHNTSIMELGTYRDLFTFPQIEGVFVGHYGGIDLTLCDGNGLNGIGNKLMPAIRKLQLGLNLLQSPLASGSTALESSAWSAHLIFIGRRK